MCSELTGMWHCSETYRLTIKTEGVGARHRARCQPLVFSTSNIASLYILLLSSTPPPTWGWMGSLTDINLLRWHIFREGGGCSRRGRRPLTTALLSPLCLHQHCSQPQLLHDWCPLPNLSTTPLWCRGSWWKCLLIAVPCMYLIFSQLCIWMARTNIHQTKAFLLSTPSQHTALGKQCICNCVFFFFFFELLPSSLFSTDLAFHVPHITSSSHFLSNPHRHILNLCVPEIHLTVLLRPTIW